MNLVVQFKNTKEWVLSFNNISYSSLLIVKTRQYDTFFYHSKIAVSLYAWNPLVTRSIRFWVKLLFDPADLIFGRKLENLKMIRKYKSYWTNFFPTSIDHNVIVKQSHNLGQSSARNVTLSSGIKIIVSFFFFDNYFIIRSFRSLQLLGTG